MQRGWFEVLHGGERSRQQQSGWAWPLQAEAGQGPPRQLCRGSAQAGTSTHSISKAGSTSAQCLQHSWWWTRKLSPKEDHQQASQHMDRRNWGRERENDLWHVSRPLPEADHFQRGQLTGGRIRPDFQPVLIWYLSRSFWRVLSLLFKHPFSFAQWRVNLSQWFCCSQKKYSP